MDADVSFANRVRYLLDVNDFAGMNAAYGTHFTSSPPSRATIQVAALPKKGALVEISAIAVASE